MDPIPFLVVGDGPHEQTGLGRIARDLCAILHTTTALPIDLVQVGGAVPPCWTHWKHVPLDRQEDWGAQNVGQIYRSIFGERPGILFGIWDPARLFDYLALDLPVQRWAYTAIDTHNTWGGVGGPAGQVLRQFDRVLAYTRYGAEVIKQTTQQNVAYLPHGITLETFRDVSDEEQQEARATLGPHAINKRILGSVMANQPRKDFGLYFGTLTELKRRGHKVHGWLHTDVLVKDWAVQQLVEDFGLEKQVTITGQLTDRQLAALYHACDLTILPTGGEGFGYPIVESYAAGRVCIHSDWAGGSELVPKTEWRVPVRETYLTSVYAMKRPVMRVEDWANAVERAGRWQDQVGIPTVDAYLRGSVAHLDWSVLKDRWISWVRRGLDL